MLRLFVDEDLATLNEWYAARDMPAVERRVLPTTGFVEPGVAMGFFYRTDSGIGLVHHLATNRAAPVADRRLAVLEILRACEDLARGLGLAVVMSWTDIPVVIDAAETVGGHSLGRVTLLGKVL